MKKINILLTLLVLVGVRSLHDITIGQSLVAIAVISLYAFKMFMDSKKQPDVSEDIRKQIEDIRNVVSSLSVKSVSRAPQEGKRYF